MRTSTFLFATDLHDEGFDVVLDNIQARGELNGVTFAASYHHARDIFPHNPVRKVRFLEGGAVFFRPEEHRYEGLTIRPHVSQLARETDILGRLTEAAEQRDLHVRAWVVYLHNTILGSRYQSCCVRNAFGDPYITNLCPANPDVRAYARALTADLARYRVETILAESLAYPQFEHGYHHERSFVPLSPLAKYLFGLCFCEHCLAAARRNAIAAEHVQEWVRTQLESVLSGVELAGDVEQESLANLAGGEMGGYLAARDATVASLAGEVTDAIEKISETRFIFMDMSGAGKGYATGQPTGGPAPEIAWQSGVDLPAVSRNCHGIEAIGYAQDPARLRLDLDAYRALMPSNASLSVALRPMAPDCDGPANLRTKVELARQLGLESVNFYHYGFMPLDRLDWIREALT